MFTFVATNLFTIGVIGVCALVVACGGQSERIRLHDLRPAAPVASMSASSATPVTPPGSEVTRALALTSSNALRLEPVAPAQLTVPWRVGFAAGCFENDTPGTPSPAPDVQVLGNFTAEGYTLRLKLDAAISRRIPDRSAERRGIALASLFDVWSPLRGGRHRLTVFAAREGDDLIPVDDANKPAVAFCDFELDERGAVAVKTDEPRWSVLGPEGTRHGAAAAELLLQTYWGAPSMGARTAGPGHERVLIQRPDGVREVHPLLGGAERVLSSVPAASLPAGDYALWLQGTSHEGAEHEAPSVVAAHVVTVNPE